MSHIGNLSVSTDVKMTHAGNSRATSMAGITWYGGQPKSVCTSNQRSNAHTAW